MKRRDVLSVLAGIGIAATAKAQGSVGAYCAARGVAGALRVREDRSEFCYAGIRHGFDFL